jgi:small-conductance mechanosensitive channel
LLQDRLASPLLTSIAARVIAIPVFVLGLYLVLQVAGLTRLALTLLGGTGIVGIVVGFAFRDIAENFLASILLSMQQPFRREDVIKVAEHMGIVQQMNTRSTVLMTLEGNHVQIPNAVIFKSTIINYTANPNRRSEFKVGIGYDSSISQAQEIIAGVLTAHPAVLTSPEPLVLVDELGTSAVNLCIQFWSDATQFSPPKVKSSLIRLTKRALEDAYISMPDEAREVIFPKGVPLLQMPPQETEAAKQVHKHSVGQPSAGPTRTEPLITAAEGDLNSEDQEIRAQAERARVPEQGEDLLEGD